ncbi:hypothetical protein HYH03_012803 [Edaphochlamys debaryana]|uniref:Uncharacterized protein n=1 Tax=Edaphochlamys debaryana TaxID=47281 RepID=A0A836BTR9_9CHLO|nr:hypothetical protein HYH03_012803 [Edaphochlamys debaryana]|eukprot:KAG2488635.1 hypothetical protein HYH03_012803 [Edaphochlamys debaryana]
MPSAAELWQKHELYEQALKAALQRELRLGDDATAEEKARLEEEINLLLSINCHLLKLIAHITEHQEAELVNRSSGSGGGSNRESSTAAARAGGGSGSAGSSTAGPNAPGPHGPEAPHNAERPAASQQQVRRRTSSTPTHIDRSHPPPSTTTGGASAAAGHASEADVLLTLTAPASARQGGGGALRHRKGANSRGRPRLAGDGSREREQRAGPAGPTGLAAGAEGLRGRSPWSLAALLQQWWAAPSPSS